MSVDTAVAPGTAEASEVASRCVPQRHTRRISHRGSSAGRLVARTACAIAVAAPLVVSCSAGSDSATSKSPSASGSRSATTSAAAATGTPEPSATPCPNPEGQACLGAVAAGTYTTRIFRPQITYTLPAGWKNYEDTPGNFLLVPPRGDLPGVNGGTSDFIGIYSSVAPPNGCEDGPAPGVLATVAGYRAWAARQPGFRSPRFRPTSVGGLSGIVADLRLARGWSKTCVYSAGLPVQPMITGLGVSYLEHNLLPGQVTRLYLLDYLDGALAIEIVDIKDAHHLAEYERVVRTLRFVT